MTGYIVYLKEGLGVRVRVKKKKENKLSPILVKLWTPLLMLQYLEDSNMPFPFSPLVVGFSIKLKLFLTVYLNEYILYFIWLDILCVWKRDWGLGLGLKKSRKKAEPGIWRSKNGPHAQHTHCWLCLTDTYNAALCTHSRGQLPYSGGATSSSQSYPGGASTISRRWESWSEDPKF